MYQPQENFHGYGALTSLFPQLFGVPPKQQYGYAAIENQMGEIARHNAAMSEQMNAIPLNVSRLGFKEMCSMCGKVKRLRGNRCVNCYTQNRSRLWYIRYGLGLA